MPDVTITTHEGPVVTAESVGTTVTVAYGAPGQTGPAGPAGPEGPAGPAGEGVPVGGTVGQVLAKASGADFDTHWVDDGAAGGGSTVTVDADGTVTVDATSVELATDAQLTAHQADTTSVHGIVDTSALIVEGDTRLTDARTPTAHTHPAAEVTGLATVATTGAYADLTGKPTIPDSPDDVGAQPLDSDLTAIAALTTTTFGRALLALADAAAGRTSLGLGTAAVEAAGAFQPTDSDLTAIAALSTTSYGRAFLTLADGAALRAVLGTGTASSSTYLRGDGTWATPSGGGGSASGEYDWSYTPYLLQGIGATKVGAWTTFANASHVTGGIYFNSSSAQNDSVAWPIWLSDGTYTLQVIAQSDSTRAIQTWEMDDGAGSYTTLGTLDYYGGSSVNNTVKTLSFTVSTGLVRRTLRARAATRNASASGWYMAFNEVRVLRTA